MYTQPQASAWCAKLSGRLPIVHTYNDNEDVAKAAGSVKNIYTNHMYTGMYDSNIHTIEYYKNCL